MQDSTEGMPEGIETLNQASIASEKKCFDIIYRISLFIDFK